MAPLAIVALLVLGASSPTPVPAAAAIPPGARRLTLFYTAEVHGAVEPCGCTSDPLGDISRLAPLIADARRIGGVALVDAGGLLYPEGLIAKKERPSADLRGEFLATQMGKLGLIGGGLGETDASSGADAIRPPRLASNLSTSSSIIRAPRVDVIAGIRVGVLGIADPIVASLISAKTGDMLESARRDVAVLRKAGAEIVVVLAAVDKNAARKLARDSGADVVVLGKRVGPGMPRLEKIGRAFLVAPAEELQRVGRLEIVLRSPTLPGTAPDLQDAGGPDAIALRREEITRSLDRLRVGLASWTGAGAAGSTGGTTSNDESFVAAKKREQAELETERAQLDRPWAPPAAGNYVVNALVPLRRSLRRDATVAAAMKKLDQRIAALNLKQATPPPRAEAGRAFYVGMNKCAGCHAAATTFWKHTVHGHAWKTLVDDGKQADYKCIGCHVTGFGQVGGSALGFTKNLESVQCETCHGPGSAHVVGEGNEEPLAIKRDTPESVCLGCHTEQHSDTFQFQAYMRDIVGQGHAAKRLEALGPGPTGHVLRSTALAKAKVAAAEQAKKM
jgi:hypothetical protein